MPDEWNGEMKSEDGRANGRKEETKENQKTSSDRSDGRGLAHQIVHPPKEKTPHRSQSAAEINVGAAGLGHGRAKFGNGEGAEERKNTADNPNEKHQANGTGCACHRAGHEKNACADDVAHNHGHRGPRAKPLYQLQLFFGHVPPLRLSCWLTTSTRQFVIVA